MGNNHHALPKTTDDACSKTTTILGWKQPPELTEKQPPAYRKEPQAYRKRNHDRLTENNHQLTENNHQLTENNHLPNKNNYQLTDNNHQLTENNHQITENKHQLTENNHQLTQNNHQLTEKTNNLKKTTTSLPKIITSLQKTLLVLKNPWHDQQLFRPSIDRIQCSGTHYILLGERFWLDCTEPWFLNMWYHSLGSQPHSNQGSWLSGRTEVATLDLIVSSAWLLPDSKGWRKDKDNLFASERMLPEV